MAANGEENQDPVRVGPPMVDYGTGAQAAFAISAALFQRHNTGRGQFIDVSMLVAALMMMSAQVVDTLITGKPPIPHGNKHPNNSGYATYDTANGKIMLGAWTNKQLASLMAALGEKDRAKEILATSRHLIGDKRAQDAEVISKKLQQKPASEWEQIFNEQHIPAARVRTLDETLHEQQLLERNALQPMINTPDGCPDKLPVCAFSYQHGSPSINSAPPQLGQHTREVLLEAGFSADEIDQMKRDGTA